MIEYEQWQIDSGMTVSWDADVHEFTDAEETVYPNGDRLPGIWVTESVYDSDGNYLGHTYTFPYDPAQDEHGENALFYGGQLYNDAMELSAPEYAKRRKELFQTAEILYRHAVGQGNIFGDLCLGYVYYYDRAQGDYWRSGTGIDGSIADDRLRPFPVEEEAFRHFEVASEGGLVEGSYKLGDCHKNGIGCEVDEAAAFACYEKALAQDNRHSAYLSGSICLRLGTCYEEGLGCPHDFRRALDFYRDAEALLAAAVNQGDWFYEKALLGARAGVRRCEQELG